uniref:Uncharacterized protein n=1 Tax=Vespula pensylvanica TaxID=30213 RepID=A0A834NCS3_VESPE|nr:hypothetical protein H0235_014919 [Vespula pensylvanica]
MSNKRQFQERHIATVLLKNSKLSALEIRSTFDEGVPVPFTPLNLSKLRTFFCKFGLDLLLNESHSVEDVPPVFEFIDAKSSFLTDDPSASIHFVECSCLLEVADGEEVGELDNEFSAWSFRLLSRTLPSIID